jgi:hypothetical protein
MYAYAPRTLRFLKFGFEKKRLLRVFFGQVTLVAFYSVGNMLSVLVQPIKPWENLLLLLCILYFLEFCSFDVQ